MANNPKTYDCRIDLRNLFSALSDCRRATLRELPVDFFVGFFQRVVTNLRVSNDYRDICHQAVREFRTGGSSKYRDMWRDTTIDILEQELEIRDISNSHIISKVYEEYLSNYSYYIMVEFDKVANQF